jgi:molybdate transport system substrate-binding protein
MHKPIAQQAVLLDRGRDNPAAKAWMTFLKAPEARTIIRRHGYDLVERP